MNATIAPITCKHESLRRSFRLAQHLLPAAAVVDPLLVEYIREDILGKPSAIRDNQLVETTWSELTPEEQRQAHVNLFHSEYE